jgi:DNA-binding MarR family transcriptional regulator
LQKNMHGGRGAVSEAELPDGDRLGRELSDAVVLFHEAIGAISGLSATDHKAVGIIARQGPLSATALAEATGLTAGAVTGLVDRLERSGHVRRERDQRDRRRVVITATAEPDPRVGQAFASLAAAMAEANQGFSPEQQRAVAAWVVRTTEILREQTRQLTGFRG